MRKAALDAVVIGCGVIGITSALELAARGWTVRVVAREPPQGTTSAIAAAVWFPFRVGPAERTAPWARATYAQLEADASDPTSGVRMRWGEIVGQRAPDAEVSSMLPDGAWRPTRRRRRAGVPSYRVRVPCVDMPVYLRWLVTRLDAAGVRIEQRTVHSLSDIARAALIVDCAGLGARELANDASLFPIRGQVVRVREPRMRRVFVIDDDNPAGLTYIVPRHDSTVLGGTAVDDEWSTVPDPAVTRGILDRCRELDPRLAGAEPLESAVGLRPGRDAVRLDEERLASGTRCIHNYGHGGGGVTLSWGCAREVSRLAGASGTCVAPRR